MPDNQDLSTTLHAQPAAPSDSSTQAQNDDAASPTTPGNLPLRTPGPATQPLTPTPQPQQPQAPQNPDATQTAHHSILGRVAERLFAGGQTQYTVDPATGKTVSTFIKETPGQLFRNVLAGAIMGGAAGTGSTDFFGGFAKGGAAVIENQQQQNQQRRANAQRDFENKQQIQKSSQVDDKIAAEKTKNAAAEAHWTAITTVRDMTANHRGLESLQRETALNLRKRESDLKAGALDAPIKGNGQPGNGAEMQKLFTEHPEEFATPTGYTMSVTKEYDTSDLKYDFDKNGWEDEDGNPTDLSKHTTWRVAYVPDGSANKPQQYTGKELMTYFPDIYQDRLDPDKTYSMSHRDFTSVAERQSSLEHQDFQDQFKRTHEDVTNVIREGKNRLASLHDQYTAAMKGPVPDEEKGAEIQGQIDALNDELEQKVQSADPHLRKTMRNFANTPMPTPVGPTPANPQTQPTAPVTPGQIVPANPSQQTPASGKPLIKPPKRGAPLTPALVDRYIAANGGDKAKARAAALNDGWTVPQAK